MRGGAAASQNLNRGGRGGAHVSRRHVRFGEVGCAASAAARWAKGRGGLLTWRGVIFGSWREPWRVLRGSVAVNEDSSPGKEAASCRGRGGLTFR